MKQKRMIVFNIIKTTIQTITYHKSKLIKKRYYKKLSVSVEQYICVMLHTIHCYYSHLHVYTCASIVMCMYNYGSQSTIPVLQLLSLKIGTISPLQICHHK